MIAKKIIIALLMLFPLITHNAPYVYVANNGAPEVAVIDGATNSILTTISIPSLPYAMGQFLTCIASAPNGKTVCVCNGNAISTSPVAISISVIDATLTIPALLVPIIEGFNMFSYPIDIAYTTDSNSVYITGEDGNVYSVTGITSSQTVATATSAIPNPYAIAIGNTPNETAYIGTYGSGIYYMPVPANTPLHQIPFSDYSNIHIQGIAIAPNGLTVYAVGDDSLYNKALLYVIDTGSNMITDTIDLPSGSGPTGIVVSPDGNYLYITDQSNNDVIVIPTNNLSNISTFSSPNSPIALAITSDSKGLYVANGNPTVSSYLVPAGTPAASPIDLFPGGGRVLPFGITVIGSLSLLPPSSVSGCKTKNVFLLQTDYINNITWTAPTSGSPAAYAIYRDATLTQLAAMVPASGPLQYYDHGRNPNVTDSYYIVSVDANGNQSTANSVTVTQNC
jgi:YVTN family beta-propeller protein